MKVMCICEKFRDPDGNEPKFGEIVTAFQSKCHKEGYDIAEYPYDSDGLPQSFRKILFISISDIDETELVKERELVNA